MSGDNPNYADMANAIRFLSADAVQAAKSGHPGMPMGMADVATVLFSKFLKFDAAAPDWSDRDRFVLSAGHGSMLLYSLLHLTGYPGMDIEQIKNFRQLGYKTAGHPEYGHAPGIETTTGPLGQGLATAVGMALGERMMNARFGDAVVNHFTYVISGDGCLMEGISHEAISLAGHLKLSNLIVLFDDNSITIDGPTDISVSDDQLKRFEASNWDVCAVDGHNHDEIANAIAKAQKSNKPSMIACKTIIGFGAPNKQGTSGIHGAPLGDEELTAARAELNWPHEAFVVPEATMTDWRAIGTKGASARSEWQNRFDSLSDADQATFNRLISGALPDGWLSALNDHKKRVSDEQPSWATRVASGHTLEAIAEHIPELIGGSADLTGSVNTRVSTMTDITPDDFSGRYIRYGVREHAQAAAMNGLALHGGTIPYSGGFLIFADYMKGAMRLSSLMQQRVIYVLTHDSIGLGEDGPTHQAVETIASLRALPNFNLLRPCDGVETAECWAIALQSTDTPSGLVLSRQGMPTQRTEHTEENLCARGGYVLAEAEGGASARQGTIFATGSEVSIAMDARDTLQKEGIETAVVSMPCWELFDAQDAGYREAVMGTAKARVAVEAAVRLGWDQYVGSDGGFVGMTGFGASAPAKQLFEHFDITPDAVVREIKSRL